MPSGVTDVDRGGISTPGKLNVKTRSMVNGQWFTISYDSANKQKHHKSHRMQ